MRKYFIIGITVMIIISITSTAFSDEKDSFVDKVKRDNSLLSPEILKEMEINEQSTYELPKKIIDLGIAENAIDNTLFWMKKILKAKWMLDERNRYYVGKAKNDCDMVSSLYNKESVYFQINSTFSHMYIIIKDDSENFTSPAALIKGYVEKYFNNSDVILKYFSLEEQKDKKMKFKINKETYDTMPNEYKGIWYFSMDVGADTENNTAFFSIYKDDGSLPLVPTPKKNWFDEGGENVNQKKP